MYPVFITKADGISDESLENLLIAVLQLTDRNGLLLAIQPQDIFQDWFLNLLPKTLFNEIPKTPS